ncbi:MAG: S9 family peptidase [Candidatus Bipolaricaulis sp.]|nr:S9 family peptidase [Candidatus Bipolaricaulis sp.]
MKTVGIRDLERYAFLSDVAISPDGTCAAFAVSRMRIVENKYSTEVYLADLDGRGVRCLTSLGNVGSFCWGEGGKAILAAVPHKEGSSLRRVDVRSGEMAELASVPFRIEKLTAFGEDAVIYMVRVRCQEVGRFSGGDCEVLDEIPFWREGKGFTNKQRWHLHCLDVRTGVERELVGGLFDVSAFSCQGRRIVYSGKEFSEKAPLTEELWVLDTYTGSRTCLSRDQFAFSGVNGTPTPVFLSQDSVAMLGTDMKKRGWSQSWDVLVFDLRTGTVITPSPDWGEHHLGTPGFQRVGSDCRFGAGPMSRADGGAFYFTVSEKGTSPLYSVDGNGHVRSVVALDGTIDSYDVRDGKVVYVALRSDALQELFVSREGVEHQLTHLNDGALSGQTIAIPERFEVAAKDGRKIDAWLIKPPGFVEHKKYPAILEIHGGPKAAFGGVFFHEFQVLAARGYVVVYCNPHGSAGYGDDFAELRGRYGEIDYDDLMSVVDHVVTVYPFVDSDRLGVTGGSYGGFMTNWIIGHTNRFRAAVSARSISNWIHMFCTSGIGYYHAPDQIRDTPWSDLAGDRLWRASPLRYADRVKTPTLFLQSEYDYSCCVTEAIQMFTAVRYHGVDSRMVMFHGESHGLSRDGRPANRVRRLEEIVTWFDSHL